MVFTNILDPKCKYPQVGAQFYIKTLVKEGASIGANATIVCGNTLGKHCMIGAGSVVTKDVPDYALIVGNPGRTIGWVSEAGKRLKFDDIGKAYCEKSGKSYSLQNRLVVSD
jgi:UDP-2-acetamido-3-amino-2,3-dideoxy-glucuronate N-acetyltransferase